jgi:hypothetical protein
MKVPNAVLFRVAAVFGQLEPSAENKEVLEWARNGLVQRVEMAVDRMNERKTTDDLLTEMNKELGKQ